MVIALAVVGYLFVATCVGRAILENEKAKRSYDPFLPAALGGAFWVLVLPLCVFWMASKYTTPSVGTARKVKLEQKVREKDRRIRELERELNL